MENIVSEIEKKCHEKLMIYHDLLNIIRKEKKSIVSGDVAALWRFTSEKNEKAKEIENVRAGIMEILNLTDLEINFDLKTFELEKVVNLFSGIELRTLTECLTAVNRLKGQIQAAGKSNILFIKDYLTAINDMVNVVVGPNTKNALYNRDRGFAKNRDTEKILLRREV